MISRSDGGFSGGMMTQGELAKRIAFLSGLADGIPSPVTGESAAEALAIQGWSPIEGWHVGSVATKNDFFVVMAKYLGLKITNPQDPKSYFEALAKAGYIFGGELNNAGVAEKLEDRDRMISKIVLDVNGKAEFKASKDAPWAKLGKFQLIREGMAFRTEKGAYLDVVYAKGAAQRIHENTELVVEKLEDAVVDGQPVRSVILNMSRGEAMNIVEPMNKASMFVLRDPFGRFEVNRATGCSFTARVTDEAAISLNARESGWTGGHSMLVEIQPRGSVVLIASGSGKYTTIPGLSRNLETGQKLSMSFATGSMRAELHVDSGVDVSSLVQSIQVISTLLVKFPTLASAKLLTVAELVAYLGGIGGPGALNPGLNAVTPVQ